LVFHAGTTWIGGQLVTNGGRVLSVVAVGENLEAARNEAYAAVKSISFSDLQFRRDIALTPLASPA
jgi:phosphoribosylamine--glycine ligase